ncbi:hypothetical protein TNCV_3057901 [Trichonephila clavipes]|nr:hypothetical protein TNCV_3057901 [Trichonephila clavipes]
MSGIIHPRREKFPMCCPDSGRGSFLTSLLKFAEKGMIGTGLPFGQHRHVLKSVVEFRERKVTNEKRQRI